TTTMTMIMTSNVLIDMESLLIESAGNSGTASTRSRMSGSAVDQLSGIKELKLADTRTLVDDQTTHGHRFSRLRLRPRRRKQPRPRLRKLRQPRNHLPQRDQRQQPKLQMTTTIM